jgi:hypothetical protein
MWFVSAAAAVLVFESRPIAMFLFESTGYDYRLYCEAHAILLSSV